MFQPFLSIIIPAHNEEQRLPPSLEKIDQFLKTQPYSAEVLIVENGSHDQTLAVANQYASRFPYIRVLKRISAVKVWPFDSGCSRHGANTASFATLTSRCPSSRSTASFPRLSTPSMSPLVRAKLPALNATMNRNTATSSGAFITGSYGWLPCPVCMIRSAGSSASVQPPLKPYFASKPCKGCLLTSKLSLSLGGTDTGLRKCRLTGTSTVTAGCAFCATRCACSSISFRSV